MSLSELSIEPGKVETIRLDVPYIADPLCAFDQLTNNQSHSVLLESAEVDSKTNLQSLILLDCALKIVCHGQTVTCSALSDNGASILPLLADHFTHSTVKLNASSNSVTITFATPDPHLDESSRLTSHSVFDVLRFFQDQISAIRDHRQSVFLAGAFAYDLIASFEDLPVVTEGVNSCPDYSFYLAETLLLVDHQHQTTELLGSVFSGKNVAQNYFSIQQKLEFLQSQIAALEADAHNTTQQPQTTAYQATVNIDDETFKQHVQQLQQNILAGDIFQVVPSRTFSLPCPQPTLAYKALKQLNPSPYMFYVKDPDFCIFGASPESALKYDQQSNQVEVYPIAGTRVRGKASDGSIDHDLDSRIELELREDSKEKAEHLMLVDLARNDIARVAKPGTRAVKDLLKVDRYSHVMHLVSRVVGQLKEDLDALHAYQACMNMGTLVGAPKVRAAQLVRDIEGQRRGSYGGAVGYLNGYGDLDTCIVIRSAFVKHGQAHIQAGAGVVFDSNPQAEADETRNKANAVITAIAQSQPGSDL